MDATATIPCMAKSEQAGGSVNVQGRLTLAEVAELDAAANEQPIPVTRAALISHILREWLKAHRQRPKPGRK